MHGAEKVLGQHQQRLADAVPALQAAVAPVDAEFGIFPGKDGRIGGPEGVGGVEAVLSVGGAQLAGLHDEGDESRGEGQEEKRVAE